MMYDYRCQGCGHDFESICSMADRNIPKPCPECGDSGERILVAQSHYKPWEPYFDEGLGTHVTGKQHRQRVMRDLGMDFKDHMSKGDQSTRIDKANQTRQQAVKEGRGRPGWKIG